MAIITAENLTFVYPNSKNPVLTDIQFSVEEGEFIVLCGASGSGKSTLLRLLKHELDLHGKRKGKILYQGIPLEEHDPFTLAKEIGIVFQDPDNQIVMNTVKEELLFGMENLSYPTNEMRKKLAEIVHFFDLNEHLNRNVNTLSGGEKQLVNLASVLLLEPRLLLLDEPTAQLDPIAAKGFIDVLQQLNDEFGITIIIVEHRLNELFSIADRLIYLEDGKIAIDEKTRKAILLMQRKGYAFLPEATKLFLTMNGSHPVIPINVKEAKEWLKHEEVSDSPQTEAKRQNRKKEPLLKLQGIDFRYTQDSKPILHDLSLTVYKHEWLAIFGGNGAGKSTLLKTIARLLDPQHGKMMYKGKRLKKISPECIGYLPQQVKYFFLHETLGNEYEALGQQYGKSDEEIHNLVESFHLEHLLKRHPYDLSGGELQRAALVGILLKKPELLLLDEPTKGMDPAFKTEFAQMMEKVGQLGVTIIMVTHDIEFAAKHATRCAMLFEGDMAVVEDTKTFFQDNHYYTTMVHRITKDSHVPPVITVEEAKTKWRMKKQ